MSYRCLLLDPPCCVKSQVLELQASLAGEISTLEFTFNVYVEFDPLKSFPYSLQRLLDLDQGSYF